MDVKCLIINEAGSAADFYPFSIMHSTWEVRCGALRLFEKARLLFPGARIIFRGRNEQTLSFLATEGIENCEIKRENTLVLNAETLLNKGIVEKMKAEYAKMIQSERESNVAIFVKKMSDEVIPSFIQTQFQGFPFAVYIPAAEMINPGEYDIEFLPKMMDTYYQMFQKIEIEGVISLKYVWEAIFNNGKAIEDDFLLLNKAEIREGSYPGVHFMQKDNISVSENTLIYPGVVIDASEGPVIIGSNVKILPHSMILGPCFIGDNCAVKAGAKIYGSTSIGPTCKVGGEIENSIIHAYSNKQHEGFLGHSYISEWVNLGADTNTSDLKNTYADIKVILEGREIDTGSMFLGLLCGDHTKSAINTSFTTGTIAGVCGILVHDGTLPAVIPSFAWTGRKNSPIYKIDKALEVARKVMGRRQKELLPQQEQLLRMEFEKVNRNR